MKLIIINCKLFGAIGLFLNTAMFVLRFNYISEKKVNQGVKVVKTCLRTIFEHGQIQPTTN